MKVFVTGADGFIGSHLCEGLLEAGHEVTGLALYNSFDSFGWLDHCPGVRKVHGDVKDAERLAALMSGHDIVFHLACLISVPYSYEAPRSFIETNVLGTLNVLNAALRLGAKVVHTSTSEVYGTAIYSPQDEDHPLQAQSPYAASKIAADKLVESYHLSYQLPAVILRPFNTYGPRQSERAVIPRILRQELDPDCHVILLGDPKPRRAFTFVVDTVDAFLAAVHLEFGVYNAGISTNIAIDELTELCGLSKPVQWLTPDAERPETSEVFALCADATKLREIAGWHPEIGLVAGIETTKDWMRENPKPSVGGVK